MWIPRFAILCVVAMGSTAFARDNNPAKTFERAAQRSTLNQATTKPFHLKALLAPSLERDAGSNRTGEVEIWWASPTRWKQEVRSPEFHQIAIVDGNVQWQKNEGQYYPEWLRETAVALITPVPNLHEVLAQLESADVKRLAGTTDFSWTMMSTDGSVQKGMGCGLALNDRTGLLVYGGCLGWGAEFKDYSDFHGRMVANTVSVGSPEVTAKITTLEDLGNVPPDFFDAQASGGDHPLLETVIVPEASLRKSLLQMEVPAWPPLQDGPLEGVLTTGVVVDRAGRVREVGIIVSDNPGVNEAAEKAISAMQFAPYLQNGIPVQVVSRITMPFKSVRPAGVETFDSARAYFERGRQVCCPSAHTGSPYVLQAEFQATLKDGSVENGQYVDTWKSEEDWRREATIGESRYVRTRHGDTWYELAEGPDAPLLRLVFQLIEPIPAMDTFVESDWRIKRDTVGGVKTVRVLSGYEAPDGTLDPEHARGFWFDEDGNLQKTYFMGLESRRYDFRSFNGAEIPQVTRVIQDDNQVMWIHVTQVAAASNIPESIFKLPGHEWTRAFTSEVR